MKRAITEIQRVKTMTRMTVSSVLSEGCFIGPIALVDPDWARCPISVNSSEQFILSEPDPMIIFSRKSDFRIANVCLSVSHPNPSASQNCSYQPSSLSTIKPINHQAYQTSSLSTIKPIDHQVCRLMDRVTTLIVGSRWRLKT